MTVYHIIIDDEQLAAITAALALAESNGVQLPEFLREQFDTIHINQAADPEMIHGLCY